MDTRLLFEMVNKKALSTIVATVLLILLVVVATAIVWAFVNNIVSERTEGVQSCFDVTSSGKVTINEYYTCSDLKIGEVHFSINIADAEIDGLIISILVGGNSRSFSLTNSNATFPDLKDYKASDYSTNVSLPGKNQGRTYIARGFPTNTAVDWIKIAPIIGKKQCDASDSAYQIEDCSKLAG